MDINNDVRTCFCWCAANKYADWQQTFCTAETSIIEEYERNLQFEQQYISSVVEGMEQTHIICPVCHTWVLGMTAVM